MGLWSYIGYKGGSEPGVLDMAWHVEAAAGDTKRVVTGTVWDPDRQILNQTEVSLLFGAMRDLSVMSDANNTGTDLLGEGSGTFSSGGVHLSANIRISTLLLLTLLSLL